MNYDDNHEFLNQARMKLGCRDLEETQRSLGRVLHTLRDQLTEEESEDLIQKLPSDLVIIFLTAWKAKPKRVPALRLDHFVNRVIAYDKQKPKPVFSTEIDALRATLIVLHDLEKRFDVLHLLPYSLKNDLESAWHIEAA